MRIYSFPGVRYNYGVPSLAGTGDLAAPPYDQINDAERDRLHQTPYHFSHLSRPTGTDGLQAHDRSAQLHQEWLDAGILQQDPQPSIYPYVIQLPQGGQRLGLCTLVGVEDPTTGVIQPHEETVPKTVTERLDLLRAMEIDLEPILLMSDDGGVLNRLLAEDVGTQQPVVTHRDPDGNTHRLYQVSLPSRVHAYQEALRDCRGPIADGHHRYKVARLYAEETGASGATAQAAKLGVITSLASSTLSIEPIHRGLRTALEFSEPPPIVIGRETWKGNNGHELAATVAEARQPSLAIWRRGDTPEIWTMDANQGPQGLPAAACELAVVLLHRCLLSDWDIPAGAATDGTILYRSDPQELVQTVRDAEVETGVWLPPMKPERFAAAIVNGDLLPAKSTRFMPKVVSGLVWASHSSPIA